MTEEAILTTAFVKGDLAAFDALYHQYYLAVHINITKYVQQEDVADDLLQEVFLSLWENRERIHLTQGIGGWLFVVSHNKSLNYLKKKLSERNMIASLPGTYQEENATDQDLCQVRLDLLNEAIGQLPIVKRQIFQLCKLEGKTYQETALLLQTTPAQVKESLKHTTRFIKNYLLSRNPTVSLSLIYVLMSSQHT